MWWTLVQGILDRLEFVLDCAQERQRARAIEHAMIEADAAVHHAAYGDRVVVSDDGSFDDRFHGHDAGLTDGHDGLAYDRAERARVVHRECRALQVVQAELTPAGFLD